MVKDIVQNSEMTESQQCGGINSLVCYDGVYTNVFCKFSQYWQM